MTVVKVSFVRSFALFYELAVKVTRILPVDLVGVNGELPLITFTEIKVLNPALFV